MIGCCLTPQKIISYLKQNTYFQFLDIRFECDRQMCREIVHCPFFCKSILSKMESIKTNRNKSQYAERDLNKTSNKYFDRDPHRIVSYGLKVEYKLSLKS